jgi:hypothetical protein
VDHDIAKRKTPASLAISRYGIQCDYLTAGDGLSSLKIRLSTFTGKKNA